MLRLTAWSSDTDTQAPLGCHPSSPGFGATSDLLANDKKGLKIMKKMNILESAPLQTSQSLNCNRSTFPMVLYCYIALTLYNTGLMREEATFTGRNSVPHFLYYLFYLFIILFISKKKKNIQDEDSKLNEVGEIYRVKYMCSFSR